MSSSIRSIEVFICVWGLTKIHEFTFSMQAAVADPLILTKLYVCSDGFAVVFVLDSVKEDV